MALSPIELHPVRGSVVADLLPIGKERALVRDVTIVVAAAAAIGGLAQISIPYHPVPITGQTFGVILSGCALGWRRAAASLALYLGAGVAGVPWFAGHASGWPTPLGGYLLGFLVAAVVCGRLAELGGDRTVWRSVPTMLVGEACIYLIGVPWLKVTEHFTWGTAIHVGFVNFIAVDAIKLGLVALLLPATWRVAGPHRDGSSRAG